MKRWVFCAALLGCYALARPARAQQPSGAAQWADSARRVIDDATLRGDRSQLQRAVALMDRALAAYPADPLLLHYRGFALYRQINVGDETLSEEERELLLDEAESAFEQSAAINPIPETYALLSSVLGEKIGGNALRGMTLGPRSSRMMDRAVELGPNNPRVWMLRGVSAIFTPKLFGGGLEKAESYLLRAVELFENDAPAAPAPAWGREEVWAWLGQAYKRADRIDDARRAYARALAIEPEFGWVKYVLLPALDRSTNQ